MFDGINELAVYNESNELLMLRAPGLAGYKGVTAPALLQLQGKAYSPLYDASGNIMKLVHGQRVTHAYAYSAFGELLSCHEACFNPWRYGAKRYEAELGLIDFGSRLYDPALGRWLSLDPADTINSTNMYQYCFNNPLLYTDPDGQAVAFFYFTIPLWTAITDAVVIESLILTVKCCVGSFIAYKAGTYVNQKINSYDHQRMYNEKTVRTEPKNLGEKLALDEAKASEGIEPRMKVKDPRYPPEDWAKKAHNHEHPDGSATEIHWWENRHTGETHGYKFKDD